jgi:uncharacterized protein YbcI
VANLLKSTFGKGPESIKVSVADNVIFLDIQGSITLIEANFYKVAPEKKDVIVQVRKMLLDASLPKLIAEVQRVTKITELIMENYLLDMNLDNDRMIMVIIFNKTLLPWGLDLREA